MNADKYISIETRPAKIAKGKYSKIVAVAGNAGNGTIVRNSLRILITAGSNARITGIEKGSGWKVDNVSKEKVGNTIRLTNTRTFGSFDLGFVFVKIRGVITDNLPAIISSNIEYWTANNPDLGGALNASQGNASATNDNSTTSLIVE